MDLIPALAELGPQMRKIQEQSAMTDLYNAALLFSPFPATEYMDSPAEVWTNVAIGALAVVVAVICVCRMNVLTNRHKLVVRLRYIALFVGSVATTLAPWAFPTNPRVGGLFMELALVIHLLLSAVEWKRGAPAYTRTDWGDLTEQEQENELLLEELGSLDGNPDSLWRRIQRCARVGARILRGDHGCHVQCGRDDGAAGLSRPDPP